MTRHCRRSLMVIAAITAAFIWASEAAQAASCDDRAKITAKLDEKYGETQRGMGLSGQTRQEDGGVWKRKRFSIFEVWASEATGTWTILETTPNGVACIVAVGENWIDSEPVQAGDRS